ncbi:MAG: hypothetical protein ABIJ21_02295 [Nanoarchaeota archaeon]
MDIPLTFLAISVAGFILGVLFTGTWKKPKHSKISVVFDIKGVKYHIHHWMISLTVLSTFLLLEWVDILSIHAMPFRYITAFFSGYGFQGLFCKDAFKVKGYDRYKEQRLMFPIKRK